MGKMIGLFVDDLYSVSTYGSEETDRIAQESDEKKRDIIGVIRQNQADEQVKGTLVILLNI
jgi:purine-binding chemotaxis protein CheW